MIDLDEWDRMEAQCARCEWYIREDPEAWGSAWAHYEDDFSYFPDAHNAEAICYFRNNARAMSAELRRLRAENEELEDRIAELHLLAGGHAL